MIHSKQGETLFSLDEGEGPYSPTFGIVRRDENGVSVTHVPRSLFEEYAKKRAFDIVKEMTEKIEQLSR